MHGLFRIFGISDIEMFFLEPNGTLCPSCMSFGCKYGQAESSSGEMRNELIVDLWNLVSGFK